jgi:hypothetical protein
MAERCQHVRAASVDLLVRIAVRVPVGGGVDDDLDAFGGRRGDRTTILRAEIDAGCIGKAARFQCGEFGSVIGGKEDVMVRKIEVARLNFAEKRDGGQSAVAGV